MSDEKTTTLSTVHAKRIKRTHTKKRLKRLREEYPQELEDLWQELQILDQEVKEIDPTDKFDINNI